jgi:putative lipase involved disintegration of autophagic bodies
MVIAYRGTQGTSKGDLATDAFARVNKPGGVIDPHQYDAALKLATLVREEFPASKGYRITLTGHSLGGAMASYAGGKTGLRVITFNPDQNRFSAMGSGVSQANVVVPGDLTIDHYLGSASVPGHTFVVKSTTLRAGEKISGHGIRGIIEGLEQQATGGVGSP